MKTSNITPLQSPFSFIGKDPQHIYIDILFKVVQYYNNFKTVKRYHKNIRTTW